MGNVENLINYLLRRADRGGRGVLLSIIRNKGLRNERRLIGKFGVIMIQLTQLMMPERSRFFYIFVHISRLRIPIFMNIFVSVFLKNENRIEVFQIDYRYLVFDIKFFAQFVFTRICKILIYRTFSTLQFLFVWLK